MTDRGCIPTTQAANVSRMTEKLLTTADVARRLGISPVTVTWRVRAGHLTPEMKLPGVNGAYLFNPASIDQLARETQIA